jgi:membrane protease YdiL (CAAX protease family)
MAAAFGATREDHAFTMNARSSIDTPAVLLQSEPAGGANGTLVAAVCVCAAVAAALIWRGKLLRVSQEPSGRVPQDAMLGAIAMAGFMLAGSLGATIALGLGVRVPGVGEGDHATAEGAHLDRDFARLALGVAGNLMQVIVALLVIYSPLFINASRPASRLSLACRDGVVALFLALPIVTALGLAISAALFLLGFPLPPETSHETLRILEEKGNALFTILTLMHVALLVPLAEEAGWRGILQPAMRRAGLGPLVASLATAILFAAIHWPVIPPEGRATGLAILVTLGFALGVLRERTGGILAPAVLHAGFNAWNVAYTLSRDA